MRRRAPKSAVMRLAVLALASVTVACGGQSTASTPGDGGGGDGTLPGDAGASVDTGPSDAGQGDTHASSDVGAPSSDCGPAGTGLEKYSSAAFGTIEGPDVSASICNADAYVFLSHYTTPPGDYLFFLDSVQASAFVFDGDAGAFDGILSAMLLVSAPTPGTYTSSGASSCGSVVFSYNLPVPPGIDCDGGTPPACPPGCASACSGQGCLPCTAMAPEVAYVAYAPSDCLGGSHTVAGSWTIDLTSVVPGGTEQNGTYYTPHGTFAATLVGGNDAGTDTVTVSMAF